ncbi:hypothetical protein, partial [Salmonella enterica]|uniref:hypothetical protein n=1 Tax=Salmonella enterica TaxID=28901 RepID=UPI0035ABE5DA
MVSAPVWLASDISLNKISVQCGEVFKYSKDVTDYLQLLLERELEAFVVSDLVGARNFEFVDVIY